MYKNVMKVAVVVAIAMVAGINLLNAQKSEVLSDVAKANVEALADGESGGDKIKCYSSLEYEEGSAVVECSTCQLMNDMTDKWYSFSDTCTRNT